MTADRWFTLAGILVAVASVWVPTWLSLRKDRDTREAAIDQRVRQAVMDAVKPIERERDYWRARADKLEDDLRGRGRDDRHT